jgi:hypothetical protein
VPAPSELCQRLLERERGAIDARGGHRLERVGDREDAALERGVGAGEVLGVAVAVPALVETVHPLGDLRHPGAGDDVAPELGVALHLREGGMTLKRPRPQSAGQHGNEPARRAHHPTVALMHGSEQ